MFAGCIGLNAGLWHTAPGCVKIRKYALRSPSRAIVGSKVTFHLFILAFWFCSFLLGVRDSPSMFSWADGLHFGFNLSMMACAALQHWFGSVHPLFQSWVQLWHWQLLRSWWMFCGSASLSQLVVLTRSPTVLISPQSELPGPFRWVFSHGRTYLTGPPPWRFSWRSRTHGRNRLKSGEALGGATENRESAFVVLVPRSTRIYGPIPCCTRLSKMNLSTSSRLILPSTRTRRCWHSRGLRRTPPRCGAIG